LGLLPSTAYTCLAWAISSCCVRSFSPAAKSLPGVRQRDCPLFAGRLLFCAKMVRPSSVARPRATTISLPIFRSSQELGVPRDGVRDCSRRRKTASASILSTLDHSGGSAATPYCRGFTFYAGCIVKSAGGAREQGLENRDYEEGADCPAPGNGRQPE